MFAESGAFQRLAFALLLLCAAHSLPAQSNRIGKPVDPAQVVRLAGTRRPAMLLENDGGRVDGNFPLAAMTLFLEPSASQRSELNRLLDAQQDPGSPLYHRWLTPEEFASRFGVSQDDIAATVDWLRTRGFSPGKVGRSRTWIVFSGNARQAEDAFHVEIHRYSYAGKSHFASATELSIPAALADVVTGVDGLDDFFPGDQPETSASSSTSGLLPDDLATIYNITPVFEAGIDGTGETIAVIGTTAFNASALGDVALFRALFNLPANIPEVVLDTDYPDPGVNSNSIDEAHLDIEWAGAIARNAQIIFVYSGTNLHALLYAVDNDLAPIITMSFNNGCEAANTTAAMAFYQTVAQQANSEGITWVNSGSDAGPASCDTNGARLPAVGLGVRFPASIPEVTTAGGTEFDEQGGLYWTAARTLSGYSALSYIPEMVWNDAVELNALWAGGGGASIYFPKPAWQTGAGVPNDNARDLPDIAFAASAIHDGYYAIINGLPQITGGTSAAAPVFAGILALLNQYLATRGIQVEPGLGNVNPALYELAGAGRGVFHDITAGSNIVPCVTGTAGCANGTMGFVAGPGYDLASGLGSVDATRFLESWDTRPRRVRPR